MGFYSAFQQSLQELISQKSVNINRFFQEKSEEIFEEMTKFTESYILDNFQEISETEEYLDFTVSSVLPVETKLENLQKILDFTIEILSDLVEETLKDISDYGFIRLLSKNNMLIIGFCIFNGCNYPNNFGYKSEIEILEFSKFNTLLNMDEDKSKILVGINFIIKVLLARVFLVHQNDYSEICKK